MNQCQNVPAATECFAVHANKLLYAYRSTKDGEPCMTIVAHGVSGTGATGHVCIGRWPIAVTEPLVRQYNLSVRW